MSIFILGEDSPAIEISSIIGDGIAEQRRALVAGLVDKAQNSRARAKSKQKESRERPRSREIHEVEDSSDEDRRRNRSRSSRRRSRSRSPTPRRGYAEYNWVMLGQFWPIDQRPAVPYQGILAYSTMFENFCGFFFLSLFSLLPSPKICLIMIT